MFSIYAAARSSVGFLTDEDGEKRILCRKNESRPCHIEVKEGMKLRCRGEKSATQPSGVGGKVMKGIASERGGG